MTITLKYSEESDDGKFDNKKFVLIDTYLYDEKSNIDFEINYGIHASILVNPSVTGAEIHATYPDVDEVHITKDYDGIIILFINGQSRKVYSRALIRESHLLYFIIKTIPVS